MIGDGKDVIREAWCFAYAAHSAIGQRRKYTDEPYHVHLQEVADLLRVYGYLPGAQAAGLLHDVLEDTKVQYLDLVGLFGYGIANLVREVTDVSKPEDGTRLARKAIDLEHLAKASSVGAAIKLADMISNTRSISEHDPKFARVYLKEKRRVLDVLKSKGNTCLWIRCNRELETAEMRLDEPTR